MNTYKYLYHGLKVASDIPIDALEIDFDVADAEIKYGQVPENIDYDIKNRVKTKLNSETCFINIRSLSKYYTYKGQTVLVEPHIDAPERMYAVFLESRAMSPLLNQRKILTMHGSGVVFNNKCLLITGKSGSGKTTLTTGLLEKSGLLLADDVLGLNYINDKLFIHTGSTVQKLDEGLVKKYQLERKSLGKVDYPTNRKNKHYIDRSDQTTHQPQEVNTIILLKIHDGPTKIEKIEGTKKIELIFSNIYRRDLVNAYMTFHESFKVMNDLAKQCDVYVIHRQDNEDSIDQQIKLIMEHVI